MLSTSEIKQGLNKLAKTFKDAHGYREEIKMPLDFLTYEIKDGKGKKRTLDLGYLEIKYRNGRIWLYKFDKAASDLSKVEKEMLSDKDNLKAIFEALKQEFESRQCRIDKAFSDVAEFIKNL